MLIFKHTCSMVNEPQAHFSVKCSTLHISWYILLQQPTLFMEVKGGGGGGGGGNWPAILNHFSVMYFNDVDYSFLINMYMMH